MSRSIQLTQMVRARPERVWHACAAADGMACWQADEVRGEVAAGETVVLRWPSLGASLTVQVVEVVPGRRLVFEAGESRLTMSAEPGRVMLAQDGLLAGDDIEGIESSWRVSLGMLAHHLDHHDGRRRHVRWFVRPTRTNAATAHLFFTEPAALRTWLTRGGSIGPAASSARLRLSWGETLSGRVLANSPGRDVAVSWSERDQSVLVLRTLPSPRSASERMVALAWSHWDTPPEDRVCRDLGRAVERLGQVLESGGAA